METKQTKRNNSEKKLPRIINKYSENESILSNIKRKKNKTKTIIENNNIPYMSSG